MGSKTTTTRTFTGTNLQRVAFPMGGMGAGMICLEGYGALSNVSLRHVPEVFHEPWLFAAVAVKGMDDGARLVEGPVPTWKPVFPWGKTFGGSGNGNGDKLYGLPRFGSASFSSRFPFGTVSLSDTAMPLSATITGWSPFVPGDSESASLPALGLEYTFTNTTRKTVEAVFSFHSKNFIHDEEGGDSGVKALRNGYRMWQKASKAHPWAVGACDVQVGSQRAKVDTRWFRGGWFDTKTMLWNTIQQAEMPASSTKGSGTGMPGGSVYVPLSLKPGQSMTVPVRMTWYVPLSNLRVGFGPSKARAQYKAEKHYRPWYASRFKSIDDISTHWQRRYAALRSATESFTGAFYSSSIPSDAVEAMAANLSILKSPTVLRQFDGRVWAWEGCCDCSGCCAGSCTHVWNYAQAMPHLFPDLERTLRVTEFGENQNARGHQNFRARLPISAVHHGFHAAADGQLGGIMKVHREWRISGDTEWLRGLWPRIRKSLDYCIETWDPRHIGVLEEPHHNTYDIEFWGPDGMCTSFYLGALKAAAIMGEALGSKVARYRELYQRGRTYLEEELYNGEYFEQKIVWKGLRAADPVTEGSRGFKQNYTPEALRLLRKEGPKYQYGTGCLADGVLGAWMAEVCGVGEVLDPAKVKSHLRAIHTHNFKRDLSAHANPQRPSYALGKEAGLVICTWPRGGALSLPFPYATEVWTGIEYQVASHLLMFGETRRALDIVKAVRGRYDGHARNPYDEFECGHWYARALSSYGLLQGYAGIRYDAIEKTLYVDPALKGDFTVFLSVDGAFGTVTVRRNRVSVSSVRGKIRVKHIVFRGQAQ